MSLQRTEIQWNDFQLSSIIIKVKSPLLLYLLYCLSTSIIFFQFSLLFKHLYYLYFSKLKFYSFSSSFSHSSRFQRFFSFCFCYYLLLLHTIQNLNVSVIQSNYFKFQQLLYYISLFSPTHVISLSLSLAFQNKLSQGFKISIIHFFWNLQTLKTRSFLFCFNLLHRTFLWVSL